MEFRTKISIPSEVPKIDYASKVLLLGSCFAENIASKFEYFKFNSLLNPFGILFHPSAIYNFLERVATDHVYTEEDIFNYNDLWHCFEAHSVLNTTDKDAILEQLNSAVKASQQYIRDATHVIITPGTAWGYYLKNSDTLVANCHKLPQQDFIKKLTSVHKSLSGCVERLKEMNPEIQIIFTVSPVRHLRDGFIENQASKARLISAVYEVIEENERVSYFPSFEIMMDELRDYRFYAEDMIHPNKVAVDYIWERFKETWISKEVDGVMKEIDTVQKGLLHRPFNPSSKDHIQFQKRLQDKMNNIQEKVPGIKF